MEPRTRWPALRSSSCARSHASHRARSTLYAQYYARDPFISDGSGASLSNGLEFTVCP
jgi:hypothetical protein